VKSFKILASILVLLILIVIVGIQGLYLYKINELQPKKLSTEYKHNKFAIDALWASTGDVGAIDIEAYSSIELVFGFAKLVTGSDSTNYEENFPVGFRLTGLVARNIAFERNLKNNWRLNNAVISIWVSNNYSAREALNYLLSTGYYGYNQESFAEAAEFYFGKHEDHLSLSETVSLIAIQNGASVFNPYCRKNLLSKRGQYLNRQLTKYDEKTYGSFIFRLPNFVIHPEIKC